MNFCLVHVYTQGNIDDSIPEHLIPTLLTGEQEATVNEQSSKDTASVRQLN